MAQQQGDSFLSLDDTVDDFYFSVLFHDDDDDNIVDHEPYDHQNDVVPISDSKYAHELQFQETLMASIITSQNTSSSPSLSSFPCIASSSSSSSKAKAIDLTFVRTEFVIKEQGESSSPLINCEICFESKGTNEMFRNNNSCDHSFCSDCIIKQVATKIQSNTTIVSCPGLNCKGLLELDACRSFLPNDLIDKWDNALCEAIFSTIPKFYCPFRDCSAMLLDENDGHGGMEIVESECPFCHRLFCAKCRVPWHSGVGCEEFQTLNEDERGREDILVRKLADKEKWSRCPLCKFYVEKIDGCLHITCRCRYEFCYACGKQWTSTHGGCQRN